MASSMPAQGRGKLAKTKVPEPNVWISIKTTYATITNKLNDGTGTPEDQQVAINYWMQRLLEDAVTIATGGKARTG